MKKSKNKKEKNRLFLLLGIFFVCLFSLFYFVFNQNTFLKESLSSVSNSLFSSSSSSGSAPAILSSSSGGLGSSGGEASSGSSSSSSSGSSSGGLGSSGGEVPVVAAPVNSSSSSDGGGTGGFYTVPVLNGSSSSGLGSSSGGSIPTIIPTVDSCKNPDGTFIECGNSPDGTKNCGSCDKNSSMPVCNTKVSKCVECISPDDCKVNPNGTICDLDNNKCTPETSTVSYYPLDTQNNVGTDQVGDNNGTAFGSTTIVPDEKFKYAASVVNVDSGVSFDQPTNLGSEYTISAWIKPTNYETTSPLITQSNQNSDGGILVDGLWYYSGYLAVLSDNNFLSCLSSKIPNDSKWHFVALTNDSANMKYYIDGQLSATCHSLPGNMIISTIGGSNLNLGLKGVGLMAQIILAKEKSTDQQIQDSYNGKQINASFSPLSSNLLSTTVFTASLIASKIADAIVQFIKYFFKN